MADYIPKYVSKSMIETYSFCPWQYKYRYQLGHKSEPNYAMTIGTRFHDFAELFFDYAQFMSIDTWDTLIPTEFNDLEYRFAKWFIQQERIRYATLITEGNVDAFMPFMREEHIQTDKLFAHGYVDRVDWVDIDERTVNVVEYKTGKSLDDKSLRRQLSFYGYILENEYDVKVVSYVGINPRIQQIKTWKPHGSTTRAMLNLVNNLWDSILSDDFNRDCTYNKWIACGCCELCDIEHIINESENRRKTR